MNGTELADMLTRFLNNSIELWEFDDFISASYNGELEKIRLDLSKIPNEYPPIEKDRYCNEEGLQHIRQIIAYVRSSDW